MTERGLWASCLLALMLIALVCTLQQYRADALDAPAVATQSDSKTPSTPAPAAPAPAAPQAAAPAATQPTAPATSPTTSATPAAAANVPLSEPSLRADYGPGDVTLSGVVPGESVKIGILERARALYGAQNVIDKIVVSDTTVPAWFARLSPKFPPDLRGMNGASAYSQNGGLVLQGTVVNEADRTRAANSVSQLLGSDLKLDNRLTIAAAAVPAPVPAQVPATAPAPAAPAAVTSATSAASSSTLSQAILYDLGSVYFRTNSAALSTKAKAKLRGIARAIKQTEQSAKYSAAGFTDSRGNDAANVKLSERRAKVVKAYLQKQGVAADKVETQANGSAQPVGDNDSVQGRSLNRRVDVRLL